MITKEAEPITTIAKMVGRPELVRAMMRRAYGATHRVRPAPKTQEGMARLLQSLIGKKQSVLKGRKPSRLGGHIIELDTIKRTQGAAAAKATKQQWKKDKAARKKLSKEEDKMKGVRSLVSAHPEIVQRRIADLQRRSRRIEGGGTRQLPSAGGATAHVPKRIEGRSTRQIGHEGGAIARVPKRKKARSYPVEIVEPRRLSPPKPAVVTPAPRPLRQLGLEKALPSGALVRSLRSRLGRADKKRATG